MTTADASVTSPQDLAASPPSGAPRRSRLLYSVSSFGGEALSRNRDAWFLYYYAPPDDSGLPQLLPLAVIGVLLAILRVLGALDDVIIGWWSDRTRSRLGRRLPFILVGTPLSALFAVLIVTPPANASTAVTATYLFVMMEMYGIFGTISGGPYEALFPELARTSRERVGLVAMKLYFGIAGAAVGLVLSGVLVDSIGLRETLIGMVFLAFACRIIGTLGVWNHVERDRPPASIALLPALKTTFRNTQFLAFLPSFVLFQTALGMLLGVLPYYAGAILATESEGLWVSILSGVAIAAMLCAVPFFTRLARRRSKRAAYSLAMLAAGVAFPLLFVAGFLPGIPREAQVLAMMVVLGAPLAGVYLFPTALTADLADHDTVDTGMRREATYFGAQNFVEKTAGALSPLLLAGLLLLGNTADDPWGIRLVGPVAGVLVLTGYILFRSYRLPDEITPVIGTVAASESQPLSTTVTVTDLASSTEQR
jgi:glycoside/pentoside/hexuronide:cation symporter, GPH family